MIRFILKLAITGLVANATWRVGSAYISYYKVKDSAEQAALVPRLTDDQLRDRILELASQNDVPLEEDHLAIRHDAGHTFVDASYVQPIEVVPGYQYPWRFTWSVDALILPGASGAVASPRDRAP